MLTFKRIDHYTVNYEAGQEEILHDFYVKKLGLKPIKSLVSKAIWFQINDIELHFTAGQTHPKESRHIAFEVESILDCKEFLTRQNIPIEATSKIEGRERFFFSDPFGNRFELVEYLRT